MCTKLLVRRNFDCNGAVKLSLDDEKPKADVSICPCMTQSISTLLRQEECVEGQSSKLKLSGKVLFLERKQDAHMFDCKQITETITTAITLQAVAHPQVGCFCSMNSDICVCQNHQHFSYEPGINHKSVFGVKKKRMHPGWDSHGQRRSFGGAHPKVSVYQCSFVVPST